MSQFDKFPELKETFDKLMAEREEITAKSAPLRACKDEIVAMIQPQLDEIRKLEKEFLAIERPRLPQIEMSLSAIARATSGKFMSIGQVENGVIS